MHHNERLTFGIIFMTLLLIAGAVLVLLTPKEKTTQVFLGDTTYSMSVGVSDSERDQILRKPSVLHGNKGVIVAYPEVTIHSIPLKSLPEKSDVIWLDSSKKIIYQIKAVPAIDVNKQIGPSLPSKYVLIFRSGIITQQTTTVGSTIHFDLNSLW